jgi:hypothetical protein
MSKVAFHGQLAGMQSKATKSGNSNSLTDYVLTCGCGTDLGPVARFLPDSEGRRCAACPKCNMATVLDKNAVVLKFLPVAEILAAVAKTG